MDYKNNIFTNFIENPEKIQWIINTDHTLAFYDINPQKPLHILIIPKKKYVNYGDFLQNSTLEEREDFNTTLLDLIKKFDLQNKGFNIAVNNNKSHGQVIFHYHMHLLS